jgi:hypothetical protein
MHAQGPAMPLNLQEIFAAAGAPLGGHFARFDKSSVFVKIVQ